MSTTPSLQATALDHLRVIRTLMERSSIYRAVSATAALTGGALSLGMAFYGFNHQELGAHGLFLAWVGVLIITTIINLFLLMRESAGKGQPFISDGLRMALRAIVPPLLTGGVLGGCLIWFGHDIALGAIVWILCYGLALQATVSFAPRSIILLARAFLITGQVLAVIYLSQDKLACCQKNEEAASLFLGLTFGLFHIVYGLAVLSTRRRLAGLAERNDGE